MLVYIFKVSYMFCDDAFGKDSLAFIHGSMHNFKDVDLKIKTLLICGF